MDTYALITGAMGGLFTLIAKYAIDRLTETNKAMVGVAAKRKERLEERQAMVIAGVYSRLQGCVEDMAELYFHGDEGDLNPEMSEIVENDLGTKLTKAEKSVKVLDAFHRKYCLYLPETLDDEIDKVMVLAESHIEEFQRQLLVNSLSALDPEARNKIIELRGANIVILIELKKYFRQLLLGPQPGASKLLRRLWISS